MNVVALSMNARGENPIAIDKALGLRCGATKQHLYELINPRRHRRKDQQRHVRKRDPDVIPEGVIADRDARLYARDRTSVTAFLCGDPPPGFSALDRRG